MGMRIYRLVVRFQQERPLRLGLKIKKFIASRAIATVPMYARFSGNRLSVVAGVGVDRLAITLGSEQSLRLLFVVTIRCIHFTNLNPERLTLATANESPVPLQ